MIPQSLFSRLFTVLTQVSTMADDSTPQYWTDPATGAHFARVGRGEWYRVGAAVEPAAPPIRVSSVLEFHMVRTNIITMQLPGIGSFMGQAGFPADPHTRTVPGGPSGDPYPPPPVASSSRPRPAIDPALLPLPEDDHDDREIQRASAASLLAARAQPAVKVAGQRRKGKGKARAVDDAPVTKGTKRKAGATAAGVEVKKRRGRAPGASNYTEEDIDSLLNIAELTLPTGGKGWVKIEDIFSDWAVENGRPVRSAKSLESKFKQVRFPILILHL